MRKQLLKDYLSVLMIFAIVGLPSLSHAQKWEVLFDGTNTNAWKSVKSEDFPKQGWLVENKELVVLSGGKGGDIITKKSYSDFILEFQFKLTKGANTGVKYFVNELLSNASGKRSIVGLEYQLIDDFNYPGPVADNVPEGLTSAVYLLYPAENKNYKGHGKWQKAKIVSKGDLVEHWLNGKKVLSLERGSKDFKNRVAKTKFKEFSNFGEAQTGQILIQDHGGQAYFKNIRIKALQ